MRMLVDHEGRGVRLTRERLAHILEHPEMRRMEPAIEWTLRIPDRVMRSKSDPEVELYYRYHPFTSVGGKHVCVVVKRLPIDAYVITAYLTDLVKRGIQIWPVEK